MNRREALKATGGIIVGHRAEVLGFEFKLPTKYVVFFDAKMMGSDFPDRAKADGFPSGTSFYPVDVPLGKTLDDAIRIFEDK